jgi:hypothetical protein
MNHIPELPKDDSLLVHKELILILPTICYLVLHYIVQQITKLLKVNEVQIPSTTTSVPLKKGVGV